MEKWEEKKADKRGDELFLNSFSLPFVVSLLMFGGLEKEIERPQFSCFERGKIRSVSWCDMLKWFRRSVAVLLFHIARST